MNIFYILVRSKDADMFMNIVNVYLSEGFQLQGGVSYDTKNNQLLQAMYKPIPKGQTPSDAYHDWDTENVIALIEYRQREEQEMKAKRKQDTRKPQPFKKTPEKKAAAKPVKRTAK